jgi:hypothetical protein
MFSTLGLLTTQGKTALSKGVLIFHELPCSELTARSRCHGRAMASKSFVSLHRVLVVPICTAVSGWILFGYRSLALKGFFRIFLSKAPKRPRKKSALTVSRWMQLDNKKPANRYRLRVMCTSLDCLGTSPGAQGRTRTGTGLPTRPSSVRVYQFHHLGTHSKPLPQQRGQLPSQNQSVLFGSAAASLSSATGAIALSSSATCCATGATGLAASSITEELLAWEEI